MRGFEATLKVRLMSDVPLSEVCVCGGAAWHRMIDSVVWCRKCGAMRLISEKYWRVPLDRAGDLSATVVIIESETPTPRAQLRSDEDEP